MAVFSAPLVTLALFLAYLVIGLFFPGTLAAGVALAIATLLLFFWFHLKPRWRRNLASKTNPVLQFIFGIGLLSATLLVAGGLFYPYPEAKKSFFIGAVLLMAVGHSMSLIGLIRLILKP